jgi:hypothetical protein
MCDLDPYEKESALREFLSCEDTTAEDAEFWKSIDEDARHDLLNSRMGIYWRDIKERVERDEVLAARLGS